MIKKEKQLRWDETGFDRWHDHVPCPYCLQPIHFYNASESQYGTNPRADFSRCKNERCDNFSVLIDPHGYYFEFARILKRVKDGYVYPKKVIIFAKKMVESEKIQRVT